MAHERIIRRVGESELVTEFGEFRVVGYECDLDGSTHLALVRGRLDSADTPALVRMHSRCQAGDVFAGVIRTRPHSPSSVPTEEESSGCTGSRRRERRPSGSVRCSAKSGLGRLPTFGAYGIDIVEHVPIAGEVAVLGERLAG